MSKIKEEGSITLEEIVSWVKNYEGGFLVDKKYKGKRIRIRTQSKEELIQRIKKEIKNIEFELKNQKTIKNEVPSVGELFQLHALKSDWLPLTKHKQETRFRANFGEIWDKKISESTFEDIQRLIAILKNKANSGIVSKDYANRIIKIMHDIVLLAVKKGYIINIDPDDIVGFKSIKREPSKKNQENYINVDELDLLCNSILKLGEREGTYIPKNKLVFVFKILYYTGARINEARAIKNKDIKKIYDRKTKTGYYVVNIEGQLNDNGAEFTVKQKNGNTNGRTVYILEEQYNYFRKCLKDFEILENDYIFDFKHTGQPLRRNVLSQAINNCLKLIKEKEYVPKYFIEYLTPHGFRYSNTLYLQNLNVSAENAAQMQGHTVKVMYDTYARRDKNELNNIFGINKK